MPLTTLTVEALKEFDLSRKEAERCKNMFALGLLSLDVPPADRGHREVPAARSSPRSREIAEANIAAFRAGWNFGETTEDFAVSLRGRARPRTAFPPAPTATSPATWPCPTG